MAFLSLFLSGGRFGGNKRTKVVVRCHVVSAVRCPNGIYFRDIIVSFFHLSAKSASFDTVTRVLFFVSKFESELYISTFKSSFNKNVRCLFCRYKKLLMFLF